jgi:hypothetical protein
MHGVLQAERDGARLLVLERRRENEGNKGKEKKREKNS